jgi:hypothetical protein
MDDIWELGSNYRVDGFISYKLMSYVCTA